jgi:PGF-CTERM protein
MNWKALVVAVTLVVSTAGAPVAAAATTQQGQAEAHSGTHVSFETTSNAIVDYQVNGDQVVERMRVQSTSQAEASGGVGLTGDAEFTGAGLSIASGLQASTSATLTADSGAEITAHDNDRGIVVIRSNGEGHVAQFNGSDDSDAEKADDDRAVITNGNGTATVIVIGDGNVSVSDDGNVTATAGQDGRIVYRQYAEERSEADKQQERMIANGTAVAEVYVQAAAESAGGMDDGDDSDETATATPTATETPTTAPGEAAAERSADVVRYSEDTTVEVTEQSANTFNATVERSQSEGKVVIMSVQDAAFENAEDAELYVDGEAAAEASSYSEVRSATNNGSTSKYLVQSSSSAEASTDVVVGINHFSERQVSMQSGDGSGSDGTETGGQPGFGAALAVTALAGAALLARYRQ